MFTDAIAPGCIVGPRHVRLEYSLPLESLTKYSARPMVKLPTFLSVKLTLLGELIWLETKEMYSLPFVIGGKVTMD